MMFVTFAHISLANTDHVLSLISTVYSGKGSEWQGLLRQSATCTLCSKQALGGVMKRESVVGLGELAGTPVWMSLCEGVGW